MASLKKNLTVPDFKAGVRAGHSRAILAIIATMHDGIFENPPSQSVGAVAWRRSVDSYLKLCEIYRRDPFHDHSETAMEMAAADPQYRIGIQYYMTHGFDRTGFAMRQTKAGNYTIMKVIPRGYETWGDFPEDSSTEELVNDLAHAHIKFVYRQKTGSNTVSIMGKEGRGKEVILIDGIGPEEARMLMNQRRQLVDIFHERKKNPDFFHESKKADAVREGPFADKTQRPWMKIERIEFGASVSEARRKMVRDNIIMGLNDMGRILNWGADRTFLPAVYKFGTMDKTNGGAAFYRPGSNGQAPTISMTATQGNGAFAHEVLHMLDNAMGKAMSGNNGKYASRDIKESPFYYAVDQILAQTQIRQRSVAASKTRAKLHYLTSRHEIMARCFEAWMDFRLKNEGVSNPFLYDKGPDMGIYPTDQEMVAVDRIMSHVFQIQPAPEARNEQIRNLVVADQAKVQATAPKPTLPLSAMLESPGVPAAPRPAPRPKPKAKPKVVDDDQISFEF